MDGPGCLEWMTDELQEWCPVFNAHQNDRKIFHLAGLNQGQDLKQFVQGSVASGRYDECVRVFSEHEFSDEEEFEIDESVQVGIGFFFGWENNIAPNGTAACILSTSVRRFHESRAASSHDRKPLLREESTDLTCESVVGMRFVSKPRGTKNGDAWSDEMQGSESTHAFEKNLDRPLEFLKPGLTPFEKEFLACVR